MSSSAQIPQLHGPVTPSPTESLQEQCRRITERELRLIHHAQPVLIESLLLAAQQDPPTLLEYSLSMGNILSLAQFDKKKKWLCEWGPLRIDETHRLSSFTAPVCTLKYFDELAIQPESESRDSDGEEILELLKDPGQRFDRITLTEYDPETFKFLHLHPCEELRLKFDEIPEVKISRADVENIAKCTSLRVFDMGWNTISLEDVPLLLKLPNLQELFLDDMGEAYPIFKALMQFPQRRTIQINSSGRRNDYIPTYPFQDCELAEVLAYITERKDTTRNLYLSDAIGPIVSATLGQCTGIEIIMIRGYNERPEDYSYLLLISPLLHKTVQHFYMKETDILHYLPAFTNLRSIEIHSSEESADDIAPVLLANADHLLSLTVWDCRHVGDALLEGIARCKRLLSVFIGESGVTAAAIKKYRAAKRPNWQVLVYEERWERPRMESVLESVHESNTENEEVE